MNKEKLSQIPSKLLNSQYEVSEAAEHFLQEFKQKWTRSPVSFRFVLCVENGNFLQCIENVQKCVQKMSLEVEFPLCGLRAVTVEAGVWAEGK